MDTVLFAWDSALAIASWFVANAALLISAGTLYYAVRQFARQRRHDEIAVMGKVLHHSTWQTSVNADASGRYFGSYSLVLQNYGLGPATIINMEILRNGTVVGSFPGQIRQQVLGDIAYLTAESRRYGAWDSPAPVWLNKGDHIDVIVIEFWAGGPGAVDGVLEYLKSYAARGKYRSIYGKVESFDTSTGLQL